MQVHVSAQLTRNENSEFLLKTYFTGKTDLPSIVVWFHYFFFFLLECWWFSTRNIWLWFLILLLTTKTIKQKLLKMGHNIQNRIIWFRNIILKSKSKAPCKGLFKKLYLNYQHSSCKVCFWTKKERWFYNLIDKLIWIEIN